MDKELRTLKAQRTKLLNTICETSAEYEAVQDKLNKIEFEIMIAQNEKHIPRID